MTYITYPCRRNLLLEWWKWQYHHQPLSPVVHHDAKLWKCDWPELQPGFPQHHLSQAGIPQFLQTGLPWSPVSDLPHCKCQCKTKPSNDTENRWKQRKWTQFYSHHVRQETPQILGAQLLIFKFFNSKNEHRVMSRSHIYDHLTQKSPTQPKVSNWHPLCLNQALLN